jgi:hypothetical protein
MDNSQHIIKKILAKRYFGKSRDYLMLVMLVMLIMLIYSIISLRTNAITIESNKHLITQLQSHQTSINRIITTNSHKIKSLIETNANLNKKLTSIEGENEDLFKLVNDTKNDMVTLYKSIHDISDYQPQQDRKIQSLSTSLQKLSPKKQPKHNKLSQTQLYHIYKIEPYGVVLQDISGNFIIARINKKLAVGRISLISNNEVIAGNKVISKDIIL